jgi:predicted RNA-binding protein (virulence factor B family)
MTNKKPTKRDYYNALLNIDSVKANDNLVNFINHELELLDKKNANKSTKPTAVQVANEGIKETILETLADNGGKMTISEMQKANAELGELSNQRISALVRQLLTEGKVERIEDKRKAYFKVV